MALSRSVCGNFFYGNPRKPPTDLKLSDSQPGPFCPPGGQRAASGNLSGCRTWGLEPACAGEKPGMLPNVRLMVHREPHDKAASGPQRQQCPMALRCNPSPERFVSDKGNRLGTPEPSRSIPGCGREWQLSNQGPNERSTGWHRPPVGPGSPGLPAGPPRKEGHQERV